MRKHLKKGFTLIELLVVLILMGLITTAVVMALRPVTQIYADINNKYDEENGSMTLFDFLNGDLRYATQVQVISTDTDAMPSSAASAFKSFIMISNEQRPNSKKGARGYAMFGKTANPANRGYCVSESLLGENDFQFNVNSYNEALGQQSLTIGAVAHQMRENDARNGFEINTNKVREYKETVQFVNMRYSNQMPKLTVNFSCAGYDESKPYIWILYTKPDDLGSLTLTPTASNSVLKPPSTDKKGTVNVQYDAAIYELTVVFQSTVTTPCHYKMDKTGCNLMDEHGNAYHGGIDVGSDATFKVQIPAGQKFRVTLDNGTEIYVKEGDDLTSNETIYIYDDDDHTAAYAMPGAYANPKTLNIHYVPVDGEDEGRGVKVQDADSLSGVTKYSYTQSNGNQVSNVLPNNGNIFVQSYAEERVVTISYLMDGAAVHVYCADNGGNSVLSDIGVFDESQIANEGDAMDIWIYNNTRYNTREEIPIPGAVNKDIKLHYIYNPAAPEHAGITLKDADNMKSSSSCSYGAIPDKDPYNNPGKEIGANQQNLDITVTIIKANAKVEVYSKNQYSGVNGGVIITLDESSNDEYWIYNGVLYNSMDDLPGYKKINVKKEIYYLSGGNPNIGGLAFSDADSFNETAEADGEMIPDNGILYVGAPGNNEDFMSTVTLITDGAKVDISAKSINGNNTEGGVVYTIDKDSPDKIWIYNGNWYDSEENALNQRSADEQANQHVTITIHFSQSKAAEFANGEKASGYGVNGAQAWQQVTGTSSYDLYSGETLSIHVFSTWSADKFNREFSYDDLSANGVTDIWIMGEEMYTSQPADWAD